MKTRESIEAQATEQKDAGNKHKSTQSKGARIAKWQWKPGQSGNPSGRPKQDMSQVIAREIFEKNPELLYKAYASLLKKGSAFGFQVLSERAYGKLKETRDTGSEYNEIPDNELQREIERIMARLGLAGEADAAAEAGVAEARANKANGAAKDTHVLPGNGSVKA